MADETLSGIAIPITADTSDLQSKMEQAVAIAQQGGSNIADALTNAYAQGAQNLNQALDSIVASARNLQGAADPLAGSLGGAGDAAGKAADQVKQFGDEAATAGGHAHEAEGDVSEMMASFMEFAGITLTVEALKEFATEAVDAALSVDKVRISLEFLSGSAETGKEQLEGLHQAANDLAQPFDEVAKAAQKLTAGGLDFNDVQVGLKLAADAAAATGTSFETASGKIDRLVESNSIMKRSLLDLHLTMQDFANAMGINVEDVNKAWAHMSAQDKLSAIQDAMEKYKGAGDAWADSTGGQLQKVENQWHETMVNVGNAILPLVQESLPAITTGIKGLASVFVLVVTGVKVAADMIIGFFQAMDDAAMGSGKVVADVLKGDFIQAAQDASATFAKVKTDATTSWDDIAKAATTGYTSLSKIWEDTAKSSTDMTDKIASGHAKAGAAAALAAIEFQKQQDLVQKFADSATALLNKIPDDYTAYVSTLTEGGKTAEAMLSEVTAAIQKAGTESEKLSGSPRQAMQDWIATLEAARAKLQQFADEDGLGKIQQKLGELDAKVVGVKPDLLNLFNDLLSSMSEIPGSVAKYGGDLITWLQNVQKEQDNLDKEMQKVQATLDKAFLKYVENTQNQTIPITQSLTQRISEQHDTWTEADEAGNIYYGDITTKAGPAQQLINDVANAVAGLKAAHDKTTEAQIAWITDLLEKGPLVGTQIDVINTGWEHSNAALSKLRTENLPQLITLEQKHLDLLLANNQPLSEIDKSTTQLLQDEITLAHQRGEDASAYLIQLDQLRLKMSGAGGDTLYQAYRDIQDVEKQTFAGIAAGLTDATFQTKTLGDAMISTFENIGKTIERDLIELALAPLKKDLQELSGTLFPGATSAAQTTTGAIGGLTQAAGAAAGGMTATQKAAIDTAGSFDTVSAGGKSLGGVFTSLGSAINSIGLAAVFTGFAAAATQLIQIMAEPQMTAQQQGAFLASSGVAGANPPTTGPFSWISQATWDQLQKLTGVTSDGFTALKLSADQIAEATKNVTANLTSEQSLLQRLTDAQIEALAKNDALTAAQIGAEIKTVQAQITLDQAYLKTIQDNTTASANGSDPTGRHTENIDLTTTGIARGIEQITEYTRPLSNIDLTTQTFTRGQQELKGSFDTFASGQQAIEQAIANGLIALSSAIDRLPRGAQGNAQGSGEPAGRQNLAGTTPGSGGGATATPTPVVDTALIGATTASTQDIRDAIALETQQLGADQTALNEAQAQRTNAILAHVTDLTAYDKAIADAQKKVSDDTSLIKDLTSQLPATLTPTVTAGTAPIVQQLGTGFSTITGAVLSIPPAIDKTTGAVTDMGKILANLPLLMQGGGGGGPTPYGMHAPGWVNPATGGIAGQEGFAGMASTAASALYSSLPPEYVAAYEHAQQVGYSVPYNIVSSTGGAQVIYVNPDGSIGHSDSGMTYTAGDTSFRAPPNMESASGPQSSSQIWQSQVAALGDFNALAKLWQDQMAYTVQQSKDMYAASGLGVLPPAPTNTTPAPAGTGAGTSGGTGSSSATPRTTAGASGSTVDLNFMGTGANLIPFPTSRLLQATNPTGAGLDTAIQQEKDTIAGLTSQIALYNQALIKAVATGDVTWQGQLQTTLSGLNSQLTGANTLLTTLNGINADGTVKITAALATATTAINYGATAAHVSTTDLITAVQNAEGQIAALKTQQSNLNTQLIAAEAANNTTLVATIQTQLGTVNSSLGTANSLLTQLSGLTVNDTSAVTTAIANFGHDSSSPSFLAAQKLVNLAEQAQNVQTPEGQANLNKALAIAQAIYLGQPLPGASSNLATLAGLGQIGQLPSFDTGGYVPRDMIARLHAGEWVIPPSGGGGSTGNLGPFTFNVYGASDPQTTVRAIETYLRQLNPNFAARRA